MLDGLLSPEECDALRDRMSEIIERMDVPEHCRTHFSTDHDEQLKVQVNTQNASSASIHSRAIMTILLRFTSHMQPNVSG